MKLYLDLAVGLNFLVDWLLLLGANGLAGHPPGAKRCALGALLGGVYGGASLLPGFSFLGNALWRGVCLGLMGAVAYGFDGSGVRRTVLFVFLSFALGGAVMGIGSGGILGLGTSAAVLGAVCFLGFRGGTGNREYVEVELSRGEKQVRLLALKDTGNTLTDPVTGRSVLIADAGSAETLLGLTKTQLSDPVGTVASGVLPGLRLIPYRAVGVSAGMLVALRMEGVRIGKWRGDALVAFAPEGLGGEGSYRALTGGVA